MIKVVELEKGPRHQEIQARLTEILDVQDEKLAMAVVVVCRDGEVMTAFAAQDKPLPYALLGGIDLLHDRILRDFFDE